LTESYQDKTFRNQRLYLYNHCSVSLYSSLAVGVWLLPLLGSLFLILLASSLPRTSAENVHKEDLLYVTPGDKISIFDQSDIATVQISVSSPIPNNNVSLLIGKIETHLKEAAKQPFILYSGYTPGILETKADLLFSSYNSAHTCIRRINKTLKYLQSFRGQEEPKNYSACSLSVPEINVRRELETVSKNLSGEKQQNENINNKFEFNDTHAAIKRRGAVPLAAASDIFQAFYTSDSYLLNINLVLARLSEKLVQRMRDIRLLMNKKIPPSILTGLDIKSTCLSAFAYERIDNIGCSKHQKGLSCDLMATEEMKKTHAHRPVPIPYRKGDVTLSLDFPPSLLYQINTGRVVDTSQCTQEKLSYLCPSVTFSANDCLEHVQRNTQTLPVSCVIKRWNNGRPFISRTMQGVLIAQTSATPMTLTHDSIPIVEDPVMISNPKKIVINHGSEEIIIPPNNKSQNTTIHLPVGNFSKLFDLYEEQRPKLWENWIPLPERQIMLMISLTLQGATISSVSFALVILYLKWKKGTLPLPKPPSEETPSEMELEPLSSTKKPSSLSSASLWSYPSLASHRQNQISKALDNF